METTKKIETLDEQYYILGFNHIVESLVAYLNTEDGPDFFIHNRPKYQEEKVQKIHAQVHEFHLRVQIKKYTENIYVHSIAQILHEGNKRTLRIEEVGNVAVFLQVLMRYSNWLKDTKTMVSGSERNTMFTVKHAVLLQKITYELTQYFNSDGEIKRDSIKELVAIDNKKSALLKTRYDVAKKFINENAHICSASNPTIKEERVVIPLKTSFKSNVDGIIHGMSGSSQTIYIEIQSLYQYNNDFELLNLEEEKILYELAQKLSVQIMEIGTAILEEYEKYVEFDVIKAQYQYSQRYNGVFPLNDTTDENKDYVIYLPQARHPLITHCNPIDIFCKKDKKQLIITGPNAGGKTVVLKTLALMVLMNQSGLLLPAKEGATLPIFEKIHVVIGDHQNIEEGESTFSAHIKSVYKALPQSPPDAIQENHLLIFDELCGGTDEQEGGTLAWAILEFLSRRTNYYTLVSTHSTLLKHYALMYEHVEIVNIEYTVEKKHQVIYGSAGRSEVAILAKTIGMSQEILDRQNHLLQEYGSNTQELLQKLHKLTVQMKTKKDISYQLSKELSFQKKDLLEWERYLKQKEIQLSRNNYHNAQDMLKEMKKHMNKIEKKEKFLEKRIAEYESKIMKLEEEIVANGKNIVEKNSVTDDTPPDKNIISHTEKIVAKIQDFESNLSRMYEDLVDDTQKYIDTLDEIKQGDEVLILETGVKGIVTTVLEHNKYSVRAGIMTLTLSREDVKKQDETYRSTYIAPDDTARFIVEDDDKSKPSNNYIIEELHRKQLYLLEIDLRGKSVEEALQLTERHLNDAVLAHIYSFSVIHGKGNGVLAKAIHNMLKNHVLVVRYEFAPHEEGGAGNTIVYLQ